MKTNLVVEPKDLNVSISVTPSGSDRMRVTLTCPAADPYPRVVRDALIGILQLHTISLLESNAPWLVRALEDALNNLTLAQAERLQKAIDARFYRSGNPEDPGLVAYPADLADRVERGRDPRIKFGGDR